MIKMHDIYFMKLLMSFQERNGQTSVIYSTSYTEQFDQNIKHTTLLVFELCITKSNASEDFQKKKYILLKNSKALSNVALELVAL